VAIQVLLGLYGGARRRIVIRYQPVAISLRLGGGALIL
jgi:hypothetical protein